ncbi:MAG: hypothetical protein H6821_17350 [Planctomycetaceae bacterium]|nr:hypothetical protein [Planctomycetaceae bacterium]
MPGFRLTVNSQLVGTLSTDELTVVALHVHGDTIGPEIAEIDVTGGRYGDENDNLHLILVSSREISPGDLVEIGFLEETETTLKGQTIEELFADEPEIWGPLLPESEEIARLERTLKSRNSFNYEMLIPDSPPLSGCTVPGTFTLGLHVVWDSSRPESARVSLSSNSLERIGKRESGDNYAKCKLRFGQSVGLRLSD